MRLEIVYPYSYEFAGNELVFDSYSDVVRFSNIDSDALKRVIPKLDGTFTEDELVDRYPKFAEPIRDFLRAACREGIVTNVEERSRLVSGAELHDAISNHIPFWNDRLFSHPLWKGLYDGALDKNVARGWAIETYFFIRGAITRMTSAIAMCHDRKIKAIFLEHFTEEYDHYTFFSKSLERLGFSPSTVERRGALPTTDAVINFAKYAARIHPLCYAVCSGLLESTGTDAEKGRSFYNNVKRHYDKEHTGWVDPMLKHVDLDESYGHGSVLSDIFAEVDMLERSIADKIFETIELFVQTLLLWFDEIIWFYRGNSDDKCVLVYRLYA